MALAPAFQRLRTNQQNKHKQQEALCRCPQRLKHLAIESLPLLRNNHLRSFRWGQQTLCITRWLCTFTFAQRMTASDEGTLILQCIPASPQAVLANRGSDTWEVLEQVQVGGALKFSQWHMILNEHNVRHLLHRQCFLCLELYLSSFDPASELSVYAGFEAMVEDRVSLW